MATAQVRRMNLETGRKVMVIGRDGRVRGNEVFRNNPRISDDLGSVRLLNGPNARPYIAGKTPQRWTWQRWDIEPGELFLTADERAFALPYFGMVLVEPHTKVQGGNKSYPWRQWQTIVDAFPGRCFMQAGPDGTRWLNNVTRVRTDTFRRACAVLAASQLFVGVEGALHHAAAALGVPAVVLWSHYIDPIFTGYATHTNIRHADGWCGSRMPCEECRASMLRIDPVEVVSAIESALVETVRSNALPQPVEPL